MIKGKAQCSPFITLYLGSIGMGHISSESCDKGKILQRNYRTILQRNYWKITISWSFSYYSFVKLHSKTILEP